MPAYDFTDRVAFVTGAARGQGRSHARHYARHGADVVVTDICEDVATNPYPLGTPAELNETAELVEAEGREALALEVDVRDESQVAAAVETAVDEFGRIDFLANNAGIWNVTDLVDLERRQWADLVDTNLTGTWLCAKHVGRHFLDRGAGGRIVSTASTAALVGARGAGHYAAAKHGVVGLTKSLALELGEHGVTVNCVAPTGVDTPMIDGMLDEEGEEPMTRISDASGPMNVIDEGLIEPRDVSEAVMWLSSDAARYVTGVVLPVDAGMTAK